MYIWVLLATFMAILYAFNLPYRSDMRDIKVMPVAEAVVAKWTILQAASSNYAKAKKKDLKDLHASQIDLGEEELRAFLPYGVNLNNGVYSQIVCMTEDNKSAANCSDTENMYIMTYGRVPPRWLDTVHNRPNNDLLQAVRSAVSGDYPFGYTLPVDTSTISTELAERQYVNDLCEIKRYVISTFYNEEDAVVSENQYVRSFIPEYMATQKSNTPHSFAEVCTYGEDGKCTNDVVCLVYLEKLQLKYFGG